MSDETEQISNEYAVNGDSNEALKGCVGCGCDEEAPATTVNVSTSVGNVYFNLSMTVFDDVPESRPLDGGLLKNILKVMFNELRYKYATIIKGRTEEREKAEKKAQRERAARFSQSLATSLGRAIGSRAWAEELMGEKGEGESPNAVMPDETQAEVGRRIGNIFKKETQTNE